MRDTSSLGAVYAGDGRTHFRVWAPRAKEVAVCIVGPQECVLPLQPRPHGYFEAIVESAKPQTLYTYLLDRKKKLPDPASRSQPEGVHGPSQVTDPSFAWSDLPWFGIPLRDYVLYELHVGTFSAQGTFDGVIPHLDGLKELGITAIELMPVAQFPGARNWGYDGVFLFAPQHSYGGAPGLKRLVNACHARGLAVVLDVVYNHLGPEGNYLGEFGYYFTDRYHTPWGPALNFDDSHCDEVRHFFIENALYWQTEFHVDALRLDAVHAIRDFSASPFLAELVQATSERAEQLNRRFYCIAESNLNDARMVAAPEIGGLGLHAQWLDDFHHSLHTLLTGESSGYYEDFAGLTHLARCFEDGFDYSGQYSPFRRRRHGNSARHIPAQRFVVSAQNHDQIGNRMLGERLSQLVSFDALKLAAAATILNPFLPMLFMGEEYGEKAPFLYFTSHSDPALIEGVRKGRREEFAAFEWQGEVPDPQAESTYERCKLRHEARMQEPQQTLWQWHRELLCMRRSVPALSLLNKEQQRVVSLETEQTLCVERWAGADSALLVLHFGRAKRSVTIPMPAGQWRCVLDSAEEKWRGPGSKAPSQIQSTGTVELPMSAQSALLFRREVD